MKKTLAVLGVISLLCTASQSQAQTIIIPSGKLAVFKAGTSDNLWPMITARCAPCFVQVFDPVVSNSTPLVSVALATNALTPGCVWINHHAGSEGGGISRSADRRYLAIEGYTGNILTPTSAKPSTDPTISRGIVTLDAFTNLVNVFSSLNTWFGIPVGAPNGTQDNPTGIATTDGTNFWGTGNFAPAAGSSSGELDGTLFFGENLAGSPYEVQNYLQAAGEARIIGGTLYAAVKPAAGVTGGIYNFVDPDSGSVVPLPWDPDVASPYERPAFTNVFIPWGSQFANILNFDMDPAGTVVYGADQTYGIVKFTNNAGTWVQAPYFFNSTNLGTTAQASANQGIFGICVDFSGTNPVIYATTMENGYPVPNTKQGHQNQNRIIRVVDTGVNPGNSLVAQTLAIAATTNEFFGGIDFTPDLTPLISIPPSEYDTTNGGSAFFNITASSPFALTYQWLDNSNAITSTATATTPNLELDNLGAGDNGSLFQCVVSDQYGSVTSAPALLTVTPNPTIPVITSGTNHVTGFVGAYVTFPSASALGTQPFTYQWYYNSTALVDDGVKYYGSETPSLSVSNLLTSDDGTYYLVITGAGGSTTGGVDVLNVVYHLASINPGQPQSVVTFTNLPVTLTGNQTGGSLPITNQWYYGNTALNDNSEYSGSGTSSLTIQASTTADSGNYYIVVSNPAGSVTSSVAAVSVIIPPAHSFLAYSNQVYSQTFDSLPDPGTAGISKGVAVGNGVSVNSINNPMDPGAINGNAYSLANPFDFTYPVITTSYLGGIATSNMPGWYGAADTVYSGVDGISRFGAQDGDQTTGGVIDFGPNDIEGGLVGTNRALGLMSTSTTGPTTFGLKLINTSGATYNAINLSFIGELWHNGTSSREMTFGYLLDSQTNSVTLTSETINSATTVSDLSFNFPTAQVVTTVDGTQSSNQVDLSHNNLALFSPWTPGTTLWLIWSIDFYGIGAGNGYAIDNLKFSAVAPAPTLPVVINPTSASLVGSGSSAALQFSFNNTPGLTFSVLGTNNVTAPVSTWPVVGHVTDNPVGSGIYTFTDTHHATNSAEFYILRQP